MHACKFFPQSKTADHIQVATDRILSEVYFDTTDKGSNMLAATSFKYHVPCACHRLSTSINTAWETATEESDELAALDTSSKNLVKFMKKSGGIQ